MTEKAMAVLVFVLAISLGLVAVALSPRVRFVLSRAAGNVEKSRAELRLRVIELNQRLFGWMGDLVFGEDRLLVLDVALVALGALVLDAFAALLCGSVIVGLLSSIINIPACYTLYLLCSHGLTQA